MNEPTEDPKTDTIEDLKTDVTNLEAMLAHASDTIARLEGRWRAPGAANKGQRGMVVMKDSTDRALGSCAEDGGKWWVSGDGIDILAWCELPPIPSDEGFGELL